MQQKTDEVGLVRVNVHGYLRRVGHAVCVCEWGRQQGCRPSEPVGA